MATLTHLASRYRWELMLIVGIPVIDRTIWWLLPHIFGNFDVTFEVRSLPLFIRLLLNVSLLLLGLFYFQVRRLGRTTLSLLWVFAIVYEAVEITTYQLLDVSDLGQRLAIEISRSEWTWHFGFEFLPTTIVLVWFARQASKISFGHALVLIGLATPGFALLFALFAIWVLSRLDLPREKHEADIERWTASWNLPVVSVPLRRLAVRILPRFDPARGIGKELLVTLFVLGFLPQVYLGLRSWFVYGFDSALPIAIRVITIAYMPLGVVLVILLAYVVRVRQPGERPGTIEPKARPTKP